jgi:hypothetical protein
MSYKNKLVIAGLSILALWNLLPDSPPDLSGCVKFQDLYIPKKYLMPGSSSFIKVPGMEFDKANGMQVVILPDGKGRELSIELWGKFAVRKNGEDTEAKPAFERLGGKDIVPDPNLFGLYRFYYETLESIRLNYWFLVNSPKPSENPDAQWAIGSCSSGQYGTDCYYVRYSHELWYMIDFKPERYSSLAELDKVIQPHLDQWKTCITPKQK